MSDEHADTAVAIDNGLYIRRRSKIALPEIRSVKRLDTRYLATALKNFEGIGYTFSAPLVEACRDLPLDDFVQLYRDIILKLRVLRGTDRKFKPMYPNFPEQVMQMTDGELYLNAIIHYGTGGKLRPVTKPKKRLPLLDNIDLTVLSLGDRAEFEQLFGQIVSANTSLSEQDKSDVRWFVSAYRNQISPLLPATVPQKETVALVASLLLASIYTVEATTFLETHLKTATDILRLAVVLADGDVSLATNTKFATISRVERVELLKLMERIDSHTLTEDMLRWKGRWIRLGEKLHPGEYRTRFPKTAQAFAVLRNDLPFATFNSEIETNLAAKNVPASVARLSTRPGDFARRLDHLLRLTASLEAAREVLDAFTPGAPRISTPVLLQLRHHFATRNDGSELRVFFPKGQLAKAHAEPNTLPSLPEAICDEAAAICERALTERFAKLPSLGRVYIDPALRDYIVPFALRSASKSLRTLVRGSRLPLPPGNVLRFFVWWRDGEDTTDIDLSAALFDGEFRYKDVLSYYNLKNFGGVHSGDIVSAPEGASEFIDVAKDKLRAENVRYIVMSLHSYTQQPYKDLPECFAGWMSRQHAGSGEIFEPRTVQDRLDITADTKIALPLVIDLADDRVIWCDMSLRGKPTWSNNVDETLGGIQLTLKSLTQVRKPNLYDLFRLHTFARGWQVGAEIEADTIFSVKEQTPFQWERIASEFMA